MELIKTIRTLLWFGTNITCIVFKSASDILNDTMVKMAVCIKQGWKLTLTPGELKSLG